MNKRLERVETAKLGLMYIYEHLHNAVFDGPNMTLHLDDGKVFHMIGFKSKEGFEKAKEAVNG